jgi:tellurite resistance protein
MGGSILLSLLATAGLVLLFGFLRFGSNKLDDLSRSPEQRARDHAIDQMGRTLRCLIAMAAIDGQLDVREIVVIQRVGAHFFGGSFDHEMIRDMYERMGNTIDVEAEINGNLGGKRLQDRDAISALLHGIMQVAACDGEVSKSERQLLEHIGRSVGLRKETIDRMIGNAELEAIEWAKELLAAQS